ncbi:MAG: lysophospholipid acyltransferase family protein [Stellaceae bacterium]
MDAIERPRDLPRQAIHLAQAAGLVAVMTVFGVLPVDWASKLGGFLGRTFGPQLGLSRRALANIGRALPDNDEAQNRRILRGMWDNLGRAVAEYPHLGWICAAESGRVEIVNESGVTDLLNDGKPGIVFGGHFSNWEVGPATLHRLLGESLVSVYREANNPWVDRLIRHWRRSRRAVAKGAEGGRDLLRHLNRGGHLGILVDQKLNDGISVPFFGRDAMTAPALARLGLRFGCPLVPVQSERLRDARFRMTVLPRLEIEDTGDISADVLAAMTHVNAMLESWIRARPEQWLWLHKRWAN